MAILQRRIDDNLLDIISQKCPVCFLGHPEALKGDYGLMNAPSVRTIRSPSQPTSPAQELLPTVTSPVAFGPELERGLGLEPGRPDRARPLATNPVPEPANSASNIIHRPHHGGHRASLPRPLAYDTIAELRRSNRDLDIAIRRLSADHYAGSERPPWAEEAAESHFSDDSESSNGDDTSGEQLPAYRSARSEAGVQLPLYESTGAQHPPPYWESMGAAHSRSRSNADISAAELRTPGVARRHRQAAVYDDFIHVPVTEPEPESEPTDASKGLSPARKARHRRGGFFRKIWRSLRASSRRS